VTETDLRERLERYVEHHVTTGEALDLDGLCEGQPHLVASLRGLVERYHGLAKRLEPASEGAAAREPVPLPAFEGYRTIERLGGGGAGDVFKVWDLTLERYAAAKVLRPEARLVPDFADVLREARALAGCSDPRIVQVFAIRPDASPPVLFMEYVDGFELGRVAPSLEMRQRARIVREVAGALEAAHGAGVTHRDLKPSNIMLDARLSPKVLDFGLSARDPATGHLFGTPRYLAPEQLDPSRPIDARTDVYALGVVLYELLCGEPPYRGPDDERTREAVRAGTPQLPVEIDPSVPEPLQAIALKAMERAPGDRYQSAAEMAQDLERFLAGRPVVARPTQYATSLSARVGPHLAQVEAWERLRLVYPHEAAALRAAYRSLDRREDDWIVESRTLSYSQIALYLGAFLLMCGSLFYFGAHRVYEAVRGLGQPFVVLALPFAGLNLAAHHLFARDHKAVAIAFYLGGISLLPLFLLIAFHETGLWVVDAGAAGQLFTDGSVSNRQLQLTTLVGAAWAAWLAFRTRTAALSTVCAVLAGLLSLALLADAGLRGWIDDARFDRLAAHLLPLAAIYGVAGQGGERSGRPWFARPLFVGAAVVFVLCLELVSLDGRAFEYLHVSMARFQSPDVSDPTLLDTLAAMSLAGMLFYACALLVDRFGSEHKGTVAWLLFSLSPFAVLEPLALLVRTGEYARAFDWIYLALALAIILASHARQRRSFYYAGILNTAVALWWIADHHRWFDQPWWATTLILVGLVVLAAGFVLASRERSSRRPTGTVAR
jgi:serine/threonine protein kinase